MLTRMTRLPLNALPAFQAVAERGNLRAAAHALHLTHSAVSQQLRVLETQLGFALFERRGRRLVLNAAGQALLGPVQEALRGLEAGKQAALAAAGQRQARLRVSVLPSFAQRWLLPRMQRWRAQHPHLALEIDASQRPVDLQREDFHAALRQGVGPWPGVVSEALFEQPMPFFVVGCAVDARRLVHAGTHALLHEPLLGEAEIWRLWFAAAGVRADITPVAVFNDTGLMLQAAEQGLGLALVREPLAADALREGRLIKVSDIALHHDVTDNYHLLYPPALRDWPALQALRLWLRHEIALSRQALQASERPAPGA
ncbi:LysR substrate-binding domain-containing protein [Orrella sp. JC864]|uniref:LysR substrate-binding domain-containing protein n=1 Tax=Orrella sp. JC864 TaxID=3120298 RepID=UPI003009BC37